MSDPFTYREKGAYLMAIGSLMAGSDLCAGAASHEDFQEFRENEIRSTLEEDEPYPSRVIEIASMTLDTALSIDISALIESAKERGIEIKPSYPKDCQVSDLHCTYPECECGR